MVLFGCAKDAEPVIVRGLHLSLNTLSFSAEGGECMVLVDAYSSNDEWSIESTGEWFTARCEEDKIIVSADANSSTASRNANFSVISKDNGFEPYTIEIWQEGAEKLMFATSATENYAFDSEGGNYTFTVESNYEWNVSTLDCWITVASDKQSSTATITVEPNTTEEYLHGSVVITTGYGEQRTEQRISVEQGTRAENPYFKLVGEWEITASKWFYSPNGSLNSLDYTPNPEDYYLIFNISEGEYAKTLIMHDFLYPGTELELRYDAESQGFIIPFGWTVLSYDVFLYITLLNSSQFSYASLEVKATPNDDTTTLTLDMPKIDGFNYVGFGLWTYDENGNKVAVGSNYRPTMFPMNDVKFVKRQ